MKVFIAVPSMGGIVPDLVARLINWSSIPGVGQIYLPEAIQPMDNMRNHVVQEFLKSDCTHLFWIDSDVVPPPDALERLLALNRPAVAGIVFCMKVGGRGEYFPYPATFKRDEDKFKIHYGVGIAKIDACGGGCLMVERRVYEAIGPRPYEYVYDENGNLQLTCDFNIWEKARRAGFALYCDYGVQCDHQRKCSIKGFQDLLAGCSDGQSA